MASGVRAFLEKLWRATQSPLIFSQAPRDQEPLDEQNPSFSTRCLEVCDKCSWVRASEFAVVTTWLNCQT